MIRQSRPVRTASTTLGTDIFRSRNLDDIRIGLEAKYLGLRMLGREEWRLPPDWIQTPIYRRLEYLLRLSCCPGSPDEWVSLPAPYGDTADLLMRNAYHATGFGRDDVMVFKRIRGIVEIERKAREDGRPI